VQPALNVSKLPREFCFSSPPLIYPPALGQAPPRLGGLRRIKTFSAKSVCMGNFKTRLTAAKCSRQGARRSRHPLQRGPSPCSRGGPRRHGRESSSAQPRWKRWSYSASTRYKRCSLRAPVRYNHRSGGRAGLSPPLATPPLFPLFSLPSSHIPPGIGPGAAAPGRAPPHKNISRETISCGEF
jgi:hypothetical protein